MTEDTRSFSEREGLVERKKMQTDALDGETRNRIWNVFHKYFVENLPVPLGSVLNSFSRPRVSSKVYEQILKQIWIGFFHKPVDEFWISKLTCIEDIKSMILEEGLWNKIFEFIEFILELPHCENFKEEFSSEINKAMEQMNVGFRVVGNKLIPIHSEQEIKAVEQALDLPFNGARQHIEKSLNLFAARESPDYENSIKESISAVESILSEITGERNFSIGVSKLENYGIKFHPAHKQALNSLYGFTSDADGIRHGGKGDPLSVNQNTARFMLVICSAFVNYIVSENPTKIIGDIKDD